MRGIDKEINGLTQEKIISGIQRKNVQIWLPAMHRKIK